MKKKQIVIVVLLLVLSGCGGGKVKKQTGNYGYMGGGNILSELDIEGDPTEVRSFFDEEEENIFSESEFVGWAEEQDVLDLDEFYDLSSTYANAEGEQDYDSHDSMVVALEDSLADSIDEACQDIGAVEETKTAIDVEYEAQCSVEQEGDLDCLV